MFRVAFEKEKKKKKCENYDGSIYKQAWGENISSGGRRK